jgi:hypothetical protein
MIHNNMTKPTESEGNASLGLDVHESGNFSTPIMSMVDVCKCNLRQASAGKSSETSYRTPGGSPSHLKASKLQEALTQVLFIINDGTGPQRNEETTSNMASHPPIHRQ